MRVTVEHEDNAAVIRIPMSLKRRGGRKEIVVPDGLPTVASRNTEAQRPLVTALARAFLWQEQLETGKYASVSALADALQVDRSYVTRITKLACLAPDIVEAIVRGEEPSGLSLEKLLKRLPVLWTEQRRLP